MCENFTVIIIINIIIIIINIIIIIIINSSFLIPSVSVLHPDLWSVHLFGRGWTLHSRVGALLLCW